MWINEWRSYQIPPTPLRPQALVHAAMKRVGPCVSTRRPGTLARRTLTPWHVPAPGNPPLTPLHGSNGTINDQCADLQEGGGVSGFPPSPFANLRWPYWCFCTDQSVDRSCGPLADYLAAYRRTRRLCEVPAVLRKFIVFFGIKAVGHLLFQANMVQKKGRMWISF